MSISNNIIIQEKPEFVSWEEIHNVLASAHADNIRRGIRNALPARPGEELRNFIEGRGKLFVAITDGKVIGTGAIIKVRRAFWCGKQEYAYFCLASVLPEYKKQGIHKSIHNALENEAKKMGIDCVYFDAHEHNNRILSIQEKSGFIPIGLIVCKDHYNIIMMKWLNGCPYSSWYCRCQYLIRKYFIKLRFKPGRIKRFGI